MFIFWCWFFDFFNLADKISRFAKSWLPIQNLNSMARSEIPYLNWRYYFVTFSHNFCQNAWTSSLCTHPNNGVFSISTVVVWTRNAYVSFHIINSWISSILEIPAYIVPLGIYATWNFMWIISFRGVWLLCCRWCSDIIIGHKKLSFPNIWTTTKRLALWKKAIFEASYLVKN